LTSTSRGNWPTPPNPELTACQETVAGWYGGEYKEGGFSSNYLNINLTTLGSSKGLYISKDGAKPYVGAGGGKAVSILIGDYDRMPQGGWTGNSYSGSFGLFTITSDREMGLSWVFQSRSVKCMCYLNLTR